MRGHAGLGVHIPRRRHRAHARDPGQILGRMRDRVPAILAKADHIRQDMRRRFPQRHVDLFKPGRVLDAGTDAIAPGAFGMRLGEGRTRQLFGIKPIGAFLRAVLPLRQGARQGFGFKVIAEARHVARMGAGGDGGADHALGQVMDGHLVLLPANRRGPESPFIAYATIYTVASATKSMLVPGIPDRP